MISFKTTYEVRKITTSGVTTVIPRELTVWEKKAIHRRYYELFTTYYHFLIENQYQSFVQEYIDDVKNNGLPNYSSSNMIPKSLTVNEGEIEVVFNTGGVDIIDLEKAFNHIINKANADIHLVSEYDHESMTRVYINPIV